MLKKPFFIISILVLLVFTAFKTSAHSMQSGDIGVGHIWAYPAQKNAVSTGNTVDVFGPLLNGGDTPEAVTNVTSPVAAAVKIVIGVRGKSETVQNLPLVLPPGRPVALSPQTQFLRFYGVKGSLKAGDKFPVTFHFEHAPDATIDAIIQNQF